MPEKEAIVLVTGASGFLGGRLSEQLVRCGYRLRAFVRNNSNTSKLTLLGADIRYGDINDIKSLESAFHGVKVVVHAAADTSGDAHLGLKTTVQGTRNVLRTAIACGVKQLIYISSCSVYGIADCVPCQRVDENGPLESKPDQRGHYSSAKFKAEQIIIDAIHDDTINITCLRPGTIWGPGGETFTPMIGVKFGHYIIGIFGSGKTILPLVYVDNLVDAIIKSIGHPSAFGKVYNVVDDQDYINKNTYVKQILKPLFPKACFFRIPLWGLNIAVLFQEVACKILKRNPFLTRYRLLSSQRCVMYDAGKIRYELDWKVPVRFQEGVHEVLKFERGKR